MSMFNTPVLNFEDESLQNYFFTSNQSMWITDPGFLSILELNDTAIRIFGYSRVEISLQNVENIIPQNEQQKLISLLALAETAKQPVKKEISFKSSSGKTLYIDTVLAGILFNGQPALLFTMTDMTEKKVYRNMLEQAIDQEMNLKARIQQLKNIAQMNFQQARKPLANILGLVNVIDQSAVSDKTLLEAIEFLRACGNELDELIRGSDPKSY